MEKLATDIYTFENLRKKGFTYVDFPPHDHRSVGASLLPRTSAALWEIAYEKLNFGCKRRFRDPFIYFNF